jgi:uncharacterized protein YggE
MRRTLMALVAMLGLSVPAMAHDTTVPHLHVQGTGKVSVEPDVGYVSLGVVSRNKKSTEALDANSKAMEALYASLDTFGVKKKEIQTTDFSISEEREYFEETNKEGQKVQKTRFVGYVVSNQIRVTVCDLKKFGKVLDTLVKDGANTVHGVSFGSTKSGDALDKARVAAVKDAMKRAKQISDTLGVDVDPLPLEVKEVETYRPRPTMYAASAMRAEAARDVPVSGGSLEYSMSVAVTWKFVGRNTAGKCRPPKGCDPCPVERPKKNWREHTHPPALKLPPKKSDSGAEKWKPQHETG